MTIENGETVAVGATDVIFDVGAGSDGVEMFVVVALTGQCCCAFDRFIGGDADDDVTVIIGDGNLLFLMFCWSNKFRSADVRSCTNAAVTLPFDMFA